MLGRKAYSYFSDEKEFIKKEQYEPSFFFRDLLGTW